MGDMPVDPELVPSQVSLPTLSTTTSQLHPTALFSMALGGPQPSGSSLTPDQLKIVRVIALVSSSITLIASAIVLHWFVRMRRNFRRQLIMILILCDSWKSLWSFIFPAVALSNTTVASASDFCQASGFFFAFGIESADFCILFIAIHAATSIFFPQTGSLGKAGLYPYRYAVYATLVFLPLLMASLAFSNSQSAYVAQTTWCYLPVRPFWYRLALAWIPRYIIMLSITGLYLAIYIYVKVTFRAYRARFRTSEFDTDATQASQLRTARHHSIGGSRRGSTLSVFGATFKVPGLARTEKFREEGVGLDTVAARIRRLSEIEEDGRDETEGQITDPEKGINSPHDDPSHNIETNAEDTTEASSSTRDTNTADSNLQASKKATAPQLPNTGSPTATNEDLRKRQYAIQRQLRFLFIYPCVYVLIWLIPFINHALQYYERFALRPPFPLVCISAFAVPIQGAVDCLLFSLREKPWRLVRKHTKQPFFSWLLRRKWEEPDVGGIVNLETLTESQRHAYLRREREKEENAAAKAERIEKKKRAKMQRKNSMTWWDTFERANLSGTAVSRQPSRQEGESRDTLTVPAATAGEGKVPTRNGSFSSFTSLGRRRSRSGTDLWKGFSFADSNGRQGSTSTRKQSAPLDNIAPSSIAAIEEECHGPMSVDDDNVDPYSTATSASEMTMSYRSANSTTPLVESEAPPLMMKALPVLPRK
ncbi:hypothetical protein Dda_6240 [Drechslerella dactyloides]|uniref:Uncharacterized protein n=1 Tax=Drechslerella dactyloides TaxID=74499 RepID=A0AAD6IV88_DREDA|nr:hypothetical protein Dda_6240 [Drechslerella dactyloides]